MSKKKAVATEGVNRIRNRKQKDPVEEKASWRKALKDSNRNSRNRPAQRGKQRNVGGLTRKKRLNSLEANTKKYAKDGGPARPQDKSN